MRTLFFILLLLFPSSCAVGAQTIQERLGERTYLLHLPPGYREKAALPLMFCLHGGGGTARGIERSTGFSKLADREGFLVVYPDGADRHWNDGREDGPGQGHDDVDFIRRLLDHLKASYPIDPGRVYATGPSNGGMMSQRLGAELSDRFVAIAPVIGGISEPVARAFHPARPVSVLILQGTADPWVPYVGGDVEVRPGVSRGRIIATEKAVSLWVTHNGCKPQPVSQSLPDTDPSDGCNAELRRYPDGREGTEVILVRLLGAGHTWPGGSQYLPEGMIGKVCRDLDGASYIWSFFKSHSR
ncbi:MAG: esterase [Armatimonadetes bacterium]|nr:esterase [Armatimonadota bacterium]